MLVGVHVAYICTRSGDKRSEVQAEVECGYRGIVTLGNAVAIGERTLFCAHSQC